MFDENRGPKRKDVRKKRPGGPVSRAASKSRSSRTAGLNFTKIKDQIVQTKIKDLIVQTSARKKTRGATLACATKIAAQYDETSGKMTWQPRLPTRKRNQIRWISALQFYNALRKTYAQQKSRLKMLIRLETNDAAKQRRMPLRRSDPMGLQVCILVYTMKYACSSKIAARNVTCREKRRDVPGSHAA